MIRICGNPLFPLPTKKIRTSCTMRPTTRPSRFVIEKLEKADAVCFDVDSTVCTTEGIDELAKWYGVDNEIRNITSSAMNGSMSFRDALHTRLNIIRPNRNDVDRFLAENPVSLTPNVDILVNLFQKRNIPVYLVSGGFRSMIEPVAELLNIPSTHIYANRLLYDANDGSYLGFDTSEPTSNSNGKARVVSYLKQKHNYTNVVMIGDGVTDLEARQPDAADIFIGFGQIVQRNIVFENADWFIYDFDDLIHLLI